MCFTHNRQQSFGPKQLCISHFAPFSILFDAAFRRKSCWLGLSSVSIRHACAQDCATRHTLACATHHVNSGIWMSPREEIWGERRSDIGLSGFPAFPRVHEIVTSPPPPPHPTGCQCAGWGVTRYLCWIDHLLAMT